MNDNNKKSQKQTNKIPNPLETLKDIGKNTAGQMKKEASKLPEDFMKQLFGVQKREKNYSGEIIPGEAVEMNDVFADRYQEIHKQKQQFAIERRLLQEERVRVEKKTNELKIQLNAIREEILVIASKTENLASETEIAAMQAPIEPGVYHVIFFEKLLEFIKSFRKKIDEAAVWLHAVNRRANKKNAWGSNYKKHGAKYLLSSEHYLSRSAG